MTFCYNMKDMETDLVAYATKLFNVAYDRNFFITDRAMGLASPNTKPAI